MHRLHSSEHLSMPNMLQQRRMSDRVAVRVGSNSNYIMDPESFIWENKSCIFPCEIRVLLMKDCSLLYMTECQTIKFDLDWCRGRSTQLKTDWAIDCRLLLFLSHSRIFPSIIGTSTLPVYRPLLNAHGLRAARVLYRALFVATRLFTTTNCKDYYRDLFWTSNPGIATFRLLYLNDHILLRPGV